MSVSACAQVLLVDAGNSRIKFAISDASHHGVSRTVSYIGHCATQASAAEISAFLQQRLHDRCVSTERMNAIGVCVAGAQVKVQIEFAIQKACLHAAQNKECKIDWLTGLTEMPGLRNGYATPATLGADRWLAAYGLIQYASLDSKAPAAVLATFGTATTIDVVYWDETNKTHVFAGGIIIAGLDAALRSVSSSTAQLPDLHTKLKQLSDHTNNSLAIPNNTSDALLIGALIMQAGAVSGLNVLAAQQYGTVHCYLTGGAASTMLPYMRNSEQLKHPVLDGLSAYLQKRLD